MYLDTTLGYISEHRLGQGGKGKCEQDNDQKYTCNSCFLHHFSFLQFMPGKSRKYA